MEFAHTAPFVGAYCCFCPINGNIKKLCWIPEVSYHQERDRPKQAEQGWAFQAEALLVSPCIYVAEPGLGLSLHLAWIQSPKSEKKKAGFRDRLNNTQWKKNKEKSQEVKLEEISHYWPLL